MVPLKNNHRIAMVSFAVMVLFLSGCAGQSAFKQGNKLTRQEKLDEAVASYAKAVENNPDKQIYQVSLVQARGAAALKHLHSGRELLASGKRQEALSELLTAAAFDPSMEVAVQEAKIIENQMRADQLVTDAEGFFRSRRIGQAKNTIDDALNLDPDNASARTLLERIHAESKPVMDGVELDVNSAQPINLKFKATGIKEVFNILSKLSGINFILDEEIKAQTNVTLLLENATFPQALELILQLNKLGKKVLNPRTIIVYPKTKDKEKQFDDQLIQTFYLSNIDAKKAVNLLRTMLTLRKIYVHEELNAIIVRDKPDVIKLCGQILESADRQDSEVVFDLELIGAVVDDSQDFGPKLSNQTLRFGFVDSTATNGLIDTFIASSLSNLDYLFQVPVATFDLKKLLKDTEILASPKIRVKNKEKAKVLVGSKEPINSVVTTANSGTTQDSIQYVDVGVKLNVEPIIQLDNSVFVKIGLEVSSAEDAGETTAGSNLIRINTTNAETALTLKDGERTVIGGLIRTDVNKVKTSIPFIGDLPLIGPLISNYTNQTVKREILLSITPHIVKNVVIPTLAESTIWSGGEEDLKAGPAFGTFSGSFDPETNRLPEKVVPSRQSVTSTATGREQAGVLENFVAEPEAMPVNALESASSELPPASADEAISPALGAGTQVPSGVDEKPAVEATMVPPAVTTAPGAEPQGQLQPSPSLPAGDGRLSFAGAEVVKVGEEFSLGVSISQGNKLFSAPLFVFYDGALLDFVRAEEGEFLKQGGKTTVFTTSVLAGQGKLLVGYKQGAGATGASGDGTLFRLVFKGKAKGAATVKLDRTNFRNAAGHRLNVEPVSITLEVR